MKINRRQALALKVQHIHWYTLKNGLVIEHRASRDDVGMLQQPGLLPAVCRLG